MYVQIDESFATQLMSNTIAVGKLGSDIHGTRTENSDEDMLFIYFDKDFINNNTSFIPEMTGWQYKSNGVDHNFQELRVFINNIIKGENCTDHESLKYGLKTSSMELKPLLDHLLVTTYRLVKCYSGYAKKDWKFIIENKDNEFASEEYNKRASHFVRGVDYMSHLLHGTMETPSDLLLDIKLNGVAFEYLKDKNELLLKLRDEMNQQLNKGKLKQRPDALWFKQLDELFKLYTASIIGGATFTKIEPGDLKYLVSEKTAAGMYN